MDCLAESGLNSVGYAKGFDRQGKPDEALKAEAVLLAKNADVVLLCMGLDEIKESEGIDRADMKLAENQLELLTAVAAANPNVVVLLSAGSSLESAWVKDCKALVYGCLGGQAGAGALVEVLTGAQNPAVSWLRLGRAATPTPPQRSISAATAPLWSTARVCMWATATTTPPVCPPLSPSATA